MSPADFVSIGVGVIAILTAMLAGVIWLIRAQISINKEFKPNGGHSARDVINRIEVDLRDVREKLHDHIDWHMDRR